MRAKLVKQLKKVVLTLTAVVFMSNVAFAGEVDKLATILAEKGIISYGEAQRIITETKEDIRHQTATGKNENLPLWIQRMQIKGDIRVRSQIDSADVDAVNTNGDYRIRERIRLRFGIETYALDSLKVAFGIATGALAGTGDKNPTSTNHTFEAFNKAPIFLDYAYIQYAAPIIEGLVVSGGKVKNGLQLWAPSQLIWKNDVNPDGLAINYTTDVGNGINVFANAGWYALGELRERTNTAVKNGMPTLLIAQPGASYSKGDFSAKVGLSLQQFYVKGNTIASNEPGTWWSSGAEIMDYSLVNPGWEIKMKNVVNDYGVSFSGDFVKNVTESATQAINDQNKEGYILCIGIGDDKIGSFGTWQAKGAYRRLDAYAIPTGWGNTDAYSAKPGKGWEYSLALGLLANLSFNLNYYEMTNLDGQAPTRLTQFDFIYKF